MYASDLESSLQSIVSRWNLLQNPFYVAWSEGRLSYRALQGYAEEYGAFIAKLPQGWNTLDDKETAHEEEEHAELWDQFADALETKVGEARVPAVQELIDVAVSLFADPVKAAGALYAFEVQQPATAHTKLDGLQTKYKLPTGVEPYFKEHLHNEHEAEKLFERMARYNDANQETAKEACVKMSAALWNALVALYEEYDEHE